MCLATIGASHPFTIATQRRVEEVGRGVPFAESSDRPLVAPGLHPHDLHLAGIGHRGEHLCEVCWRPGSIARCCLPCGWSICDTCVQQVSPSRTCSLLGGYACSLRTPFVES